MTKFQLGCVFSLSLCLSSCASFDPIESKAHQKVISETTQSAQFYSGVYQVFHMNMTPLNSRVVNSLQAEKARLYQWDSSKSSRERELALRELAQSTTFMTRFYTPDASLDELSKPNSIWKVFLDADHRRYEGQIKKSKMKTAELKTFFPYFDRFGSAYEVTFPVPMTAIEHLPLTITITGSAGSASLQFRP